ncbi:hypothetical protein [Caulobacter segnis]
MKILRSLEELVFEVMSWLVFYPLVFFRTLFVPRRMLDHAHAELRKREEDQFDDALSPPLFLMLSLLISHLVRLAIGPLAPTHLPDAPIKALHSHENIVLFQSMLYGVFPLLFALERTLTAKEPLTRKTLRGHVYPECFPAAVYALVVGVATMTLAGWPDLRGPAALVLLGISGWYVTVEALWRRRNGYGRVHAICAALGCFVAAWAVVTAVALLLNLVGGKPT